MSTKRLVECYPRGVTRDSAATKARILDAATAEFSAHGLAGARVDRIAERAGANKQLIYAYFQSKERLFDSTLEANIERLLDEIPFDARDLPGYAQRLFDFAHDHPELTRLALWHTLERPGLLAKLPQCTESTVRKLDSLTAAQAAGAIDSTITPEQLLDVVVAVVYSSAIGNLTAVPGDAQDHAARRDAIAWMVRRLIALPAGATQIA
jgi:AcrR family transcriptional regulator